MKTNVAITLTDSERSRLADLTDGKASRRMVSRKEVVALCQQHIAGLLIGIDRKPADDLPQPVAAAKADIYRIDPGDHDLMAQPDDAGYVRGWNTVKRGMKS